MVVFGKGKCNRANVVLIGHKSCCILAKMVEFERSGCIRAKLVVFVQKWLYSGKVVVFG